VSSSFVLTLEEKAGVKIPEADYPKLSTLHGCIAYLQARPVPSTG
jgi:acyl carrier protein